MRQFESDAARTLADYLALRRRNRKPLPVLWLGAGCSVSAGCPTSRELLEGIGRALELGIVPDYDWLGENLTEDHRKSLIEDALARGRPGLGYHLVAQLIARGLFDTVLTTNWDFLLQDELARLLPSEHWVVRTRVDRSDDDRLVEELSAGDRAGREVLLLRLHGDLRTRQVTRPPELLRFKDSLVSELRRLINARGLLFIGYSLEEPRIVQLVDRPEHVWYVDPGPPPPLLRSLGIPKTQRVDEDDALFDNFAQGLVVKLLGQELKPRLLCEAPGPVDFSARRVDVDDVVNEVVGKLAAETLDEPKVVGLTGTLLGRIRDFVGEGRTCLLFLSDPDAPGGREIRALIERRRELKAKVAGMVIGMIHIEGRLGIRRGQRVVTGVEVEPDAPDLARFERIVLIDSISFSGNTLEIARAYLIERGVEPGRCAAALLRIEREHERALRNQGWEVLTGQAHEGHGLDCPWGFTRPTRATMPVAPARQEWPPPRPGLDPGDFIPKSSFGFVPKPWGELVVFRDNALGSSRILYLERGHRTSFHYHLLRDEIFYVLDSRLRVQLWDRYVELRRHQALRVPAGVPHCLIALDSACRVLEIAEGHYDAQLDIFRLHDIYGRDHGPFGNDGLV